ncbi:hypothetical protein NXS19_012547 [Fusarium pseudograminearum]|nr:hypothetical protein NXS19_012547 [Fusarium pseudograminearum]
MHSKTSSRQSSPNDSKGPDECHPERRGADPSSYRNVSDNPCPLFVEVSRVSRPRLGQEVQNLDEPLCFQNNRVTRSRAQKVSSSWSSGPLLQQISWPRS